MDFKDIRTLYILGKIDEKKSEVNIKQKEIIFK